MGIIDWIEKELKPAECNSVEFIYDNMDSQSGYCLPIIYQPFDANNRLHWCDRGSLFDFVYSTGGGRLLDFGPGDGWPSLIVAPFVDEVVGVEGSRRRCDVCADNARRLQINNARFVYLKPGDALPFDDNSFDGIMAASSVEQTPDPKAVLKEFYRVLRPGGAVRVYYESLDRYRGGREREVWVYPVDNRKVVLVLYDRHIEKEYARQYRILLTLSKDEVTGLFGGEKDIISFDKVNIALLQEVRRAIIDVRKCTLMHPSGGTLCGWLREIGFREVLPSHDGSEYAGKLFDELPAGSRPGNMSEIDLMLQAPVKIIVKMPAPVEMNPGITAVK
jgi:ubiquinone/menaquinone biosynthesis C-methylase UbiE